VIFLSRWLLLWIELFAMAVIAFVDYLMGEAAQTLNGYEVLRRTFSEPLGIALPKVTDRFILLQDRVGPFALAWAWALYLLWALLPVLFLLRWLRVR